jgi:hypothetical protein
MINVDKYIGLFVGIMVLFLVVSALWGTVADAGDTLNSTLTANGQGTIGALLAGSGVVFTLIAVGLLVLIIRASMHKGK